MTRLRIVAVIAVASLVAGAFLVAGSAPLEPRGYPAGVADLGPEPDPELEPLGDVPDDERIRFSLALELPGRDRADAFLAALRDPASPEFRQFLSPAEFGRRFGLPDGELNSLLAWLAARDIEVVDQFPQRTGLRLSASAGTVREVFSVQLRAFRDPSGRLVRRPDRTPSVPAELESRVQAVSGFDTSAPPRPRLAVFHDIPLQGLKPLDIELAYEMTGLHGAGIDGSGEFVAVISFDTFLESDIDMFDEKVEITGPKVEKVFVSDRFDGPGESTGEVNLDIDIVRMIAPGAQILNFETADYSLTNGDMVEEVVKDGRAKTVTISWGHCLSVFEYYYGKRKIFADEDKYRSAAAAGVNVFIASGDSGPYSCRHGDRGNLSLEPDATASSPSVIDVGGTLVAVRDNGTYLSEAAWEWPLSGEASGGGLTWTFPRPDWQAGPGVMNEHSNGMRQSPDVSGPADCASAFYAYFHEGDEIRDGPHGCGTSASSPFWAGVTALIRHHAHDRGIGEIGYLNPILYRLAANDPNGALFHDVTRGANLLYDATPGWDYATGLGSPRVDALAAAIVADLAGD